MNKWIFLFLMVSGVAVQAADEIDFPDKAPTYKKTEVNVPKPVWVNPLKPVHATPLGPDMETRVAALESKVAELQLQINAMKRNAIDSELGPDRR